MFSTSFKSFLESNIIVYHGERGQSGTGGQVVAGSHGLSGNENSGSPSAGLGVWFATDNPEYAKDYGDVEQYQISINNPYYMPLKEFLSFDRGFNAKFNKSVQRRQELQQQGYDSIIVTHRDGSKEFILFDKNQAVPVTNQQVAVHANLSQGQKGPIQTHIDQLVSQWQSRQISWRDLYNKVGEIASSNPAIRDKVIAHFNNHPSVKSVISTKSQT
jgi:hypothetical protein